MQMEGGASYKDEFLVIMALREAYYMQGFLHRSNFYLVDFAKPILDTCLIPIPNSLDTDNGDIVSWAWLLPMC